MDISKVKSRGALVGGLLLIALAGTFCEREKLNVCFIAHDASGVLIEKGEQNCETPLPLASTFKIPGALIALETGAVTPDEKIEWDGFDQPFVEWRREHNLASAIRFSVPWFFMNITSRTEPDRVQSFLSKWKYGQGDIQNNPFMFWLTGDLRISPRDQLNFLTRFFDGKLEGIRPAHQRLVRELLLQKKGTLTNARGERDYDLKEAAGDLYAKTGYLELPDGERVSWLVGELVRGERRIVFVSSVSGRDARVSGLAAAAAAREQLIKLVGAGSSSAPE